MKKKPNPIGHPVKYKTAEQMQKKIDNYFNRIDAHNKLALKKENDGEQWKPYTITGLALALGMTRRGLLDYSEKSHEFAHTVNVAKGRIEEFVESELFRTQGQVTGIIFNAKNNFKWREEINQNHGGQPDGVPIEHGLTMTGILNDIKGGSAGLPRDKK